jgi:hypothetical protein
MADNPCSHQKCGRLKVNHKIYNLFYLFLLPKLHSYLNIFPFEILSSGNQYRLLSKAPSFSDITASHASHARGPTRPHEAYEISKSRDFELDFLISNLISVDF